MRIALLTTDNREHHRRYDLAAPYFGPAIEALLQGLENRSDVDVHVISCTQRPMQAPEKLAQNIRFHLLHVPKIGWLRTAYQGCVRAIRLKLREVKADVVHGQGTERECALGAVFSGFPNIVTIHGNMRRVARAMNAKPGSFLWWAALLERFTLPRTCGVICNSQYTQSIVRERVRRTWLVPNAVRRGFFDQPLSARSTSLKPLLLNIATVVPYKRQLDVLDIAEKLHRAGYAFELQFIGTANPQDPYAAAFLRRLNTGSTRAFAQHVKVESLSQLITAMDTASALLHLPSEEAFGLVVAEALARNLKIFAADTGGILDIARDVEGAELFDVQDRHQLGDAIARWFSAGQPRPQSAAAEMRKRYHPDAVAARHIEIYSEVMALTNG
jgi:glycosyltransferase involved in cell wall biosynthesis